MKKQIEELIRKYESRLNGIRSHLSISIDELLEKKFIEIYIQELKEILEEKCLL